jgi:gamma-glutamyltranspeptidase/glutathione hydrolase
MHKGRFTALNGLIIFAVVAIFLYFASQFNDPNLGPVQPKRISYSSDVSGKNCMVVSASKYASQVGIDILKKGGNAIDAAVATAFALAVTYPQAGNIGGGGFMLIRTKDTITSIDFREKAPSSTSKDMFLDEKGNFIPEKSQFGYLSCGVPGSVAGLLYAQRKYGLLPLDSVIDPAIDLADNGFELEPGLASSLNAHYKEFSEFESTKKIFTQKGVNFNAGELFIQKDLANTLKLIKIHGEDGFYKGITADLINKQMNKGSGLISKEDLANYSCIERNVLHGTYKGLDVYSMAPPSSGGVALIQLLNMVEDDRVPDTNDIEWMSGYHHMLTECMKRVYADRSEYLGDPDFNDIKVHDLLSKQYSKERRKQIRDTVTPPNEIQPGLKTFYKEGENTSHLSVIDSSGNMVSLTTTLNNLYGSFVVVDGAGFLLNDEMDDFASKPGEPNMFGLIGSDANSIQPNKRMLSSMTPTFVMSNGKPLIIIGSPGGGRIITTVFLALLNILDFKYSLNLAVDKPRFHHQWQPDYIQYEAGAFSQNEIDILQRYGHALQQVSDYGNVCAILVNWDRHIYYGHADRRGYGEALTY